MECKHDVETAKPSLFAKEGYDAKPFAWCDAMLKRRAIADILILYLLFGQ